MFRVPSGCGPAAGDEREGGQPEQSSETGEGGRGRGRPSGAVAGEEEIRVWGGYVSATGCNKYVYVYLHILLPLSFVSFSFVVGQLRVVAIQTYVVVSY